MNYNINDKPLGITRRTMLKATAATTAGAALFAGSARATETKQINWCGCSQVCIENEGGNDSPGTYLILRAREVEDSEDPGEGWSDVYDGWAFNALAAEEMPFCTDTEDTGDKIIAVTTEGKVRGRPRENDGEYHCNPNQCASKAFGVYKTLVDEADPIIPVDDPDDVFRQTGAADEFDVSEKGVECVTSEFGPGDDFDGTPIDIVRGRCGTPGKDDPSDKDDDDDRGRGRGRGRGRD